MFLNQSVSGDNLVVRKSAIYLKRKACSLLNGFYNQRTPKVWPYFLNLSTRCTYSVLMNPFSVSSRMYLISSISVSMTIPILHHWFIFPQSAMSDFNRNDIFNTWSVCVFKQVQSSKQLVSSKKIKSPPLTYLFTATGNETNLRWVRILVDQCLSQIH